MKKTFRLDPLLTHKKRLEEVQQLRLARIREDHHRASDRLQQLEIHEQEQLAALAGGQRGVVNPAEVEFHLAYIDRVKQDVSEQNQVVGHLEEEVEENRAHLVEVLKEKRALEVLKDKEQLRAAEEARRLDAQMVDEISMARFTREQRRETGS